MQELSEFIKFYKQGDWFFAEILNQPVEVKGCPVGRSKISCRDALDDLTLRVKVESSVLVRATNEVPTPGNEPSMWD